MKSMIGIVTVLFNSDDVLPGFFESLAKQQGVRYRLYVIDNSKTDSGSRVSRELADQYGVDTKIHFNNANVGVAKGNNQGIEMALHDGCDYVLLSNNDIEFSNPNLIANLTEKIDNNQLAAIVPKIYYYGHERRIWCAGGRFSLIRATTPHFGDGEQDCGQYDSKTIIDYAPTCFMLLHKSVFKKVGAMDEKYFVYYDDVDFLWRMRKAGLAVGFDGSEIIQHKVSYSTGGSESEFSVYYGTRNRLYFIRKNYNLGLALIAFSFFFGTRMLKIASFKAAQRSAMWRGIRDGLSLPL